MQGVDNEYVVLFPIWSDAEIRTRIKDHLQQRKGRRGKGRKEDEYIGVGRLFRLLGFTERRFKRFMAGDTFIIGRTFSHTERRRISRKLYRVLTGMIYSNGDRFGYRKEPVRALKPIIGLDHIEGTLKFKRDYDRSQSNQEKMPKIMTVFMK